MIAFYESEKLKVKNEKSNCQHSACDKNPQDIWL